MLTLCYVRYNTIIQKHHGSTVGMTKRVNTAEKVLEAVPMDCDDDQRYDDPDEHVMECSDYEFSDFELEEDNFDTTKLPFPHHQLYCLKILLMQ